MANSWRGKQARNAMTIRREVKRAEAEARNKNTEETRRKAYRLGPVSELGTRTERSIRRYREAFKDANGEYPTA